MNKDINIEILDSVKGLSLHELTTTEGGGEFWRGIYNLAVATGYYINLILTDAYNNPIRPSEYR